MVENVSMASNTDQLAKYYDFLCLGTNDLVLTITGLKRESFVKCFSILNKKPKDIIKEAIYRARIVKPDIQIGFCGKFRLY